MKIQAVIDLAFGDSGKGVTTKWLVEKALEKDEKPLVIRFSGGPQAAHTIKLGNTVHICSSFGSGVLNGIPTLYTEQVYIDPICMWNEVLELRKKGIRYPKIYLLKNNKNRIILPWDVFEGRKDSKVMSDGTCGKGIYTTFKRSETHPIYAQDLLDSTKRYESCIDKIFSIIKNYYKYDLEQPETKEDIKEWIYQFENALVNLKSQGILEVLEHSIWVDDNFDTLIYEGSQGMLLDMDKGFWPNVTPSRTGLQNIPDKSLKSIEVFLVTRSYLTRHGNGYMPIEKMNIKYEGETNIYNQYQGNFKIGLLEPELLNISINRHLLSTYLGAKYNLVITHMDEPLSDGFNHLANNGKSILVSYNKRIETWSIKDLVVYLSTIGSIRINNTFKCTSIDNNIEKVI